MTEVERILESDEYTDSKQMGRALVAAVADLIQSRRTGGLWMAVLEGCPIGPFYSETDAQRFIKNTEKAHGLTGKTMPLWSPAIYTGESDAVDAGVKKCTECNHSTALHLKGRCAVFLRGSTKKNPNICPCGNQ